MNHCLESLTSSLLPLMAFVGLLIGCNHSTTGVQDTNSDNSSGKNHELLKQALHCPETGELAIARLIELVQGIRAEGELPAPRAYKIREVIHGKGASAHSHYYRYDDADAPAHDDHGHDNMNCAEQIHDVEVNPFTELYDIARLLPVTAGEGDIEKEQWDAVKVVSNEMTDALSGLIERGATDDQKRKIVRSRSEQFDNWITILESNMTPGTDR